MKVSKSAVLIVVFAFAALVAGVGLKFYMTYHSGASGIYKEIEKNASPDSKEYEALKEQGKFNVLIMGRTMLKVPDVRIQSSLHLLI